MASNSESGSLEWIILNSFKRSNIRIDSPNLSLGNNEWYFCLYQNPLIATNYYCVVRRKINRDEDFRVRVWIDLMHPKQILDIGHIIDHMTDTNFNNFCYLKIPRNFNDWRILKLKITIRIWKIEKLHFSSRIKVDDDRLLAFSENGSNSLCNFTEKENDVKGAEKLFTTLLEDLECVMGTCDSADTVKEIDGKVSTYTIPQLETLSEYSESDMDNSSWITIGTSKNNGNGDVMEKEPSLETMQADSESSFENISASETLSEDSERKFKNLFATETLPEESKSGFKNVFGSVLEDSMNVFQNPSTSVVTITEEETDSKLKDLHSLQMLSVDLTAVLKNQKFCDAVIVTAEEHFNVHRAILSERSSTFAKMFLIDSQGKVEILIHDITASAVKEMLLYIYSGQMKDSMSFDMYMELLHAADRYCLPDLKLKCGNFIMEHLKVDNVCDVASYARMHQVSDLFIAAKKFIDSNIARVLISDGWVRLLQKNPGLAFKIAQTFKA